ncbi:hypothetical protein JDV02_000170 [Purpureocillium takamizusanense]|uniref:Uncharacterized protein n=1 Tax=Purpureocillium takamizusanense TaxID=2060973 RepID=A0A9Q8Q609_9HYPO|nr:uncharacterized protein JDV02_000170 [Purpureocillium takamizusanense]UNI13422.1 hypothetical protein JDV02_000170 [Purpureocillium takamizusanense]
MTNMDSRRCAASAEKVAFKSPFFFPSSVMGRAVQSRRCCWVVTQYLWDLQLGSCKSAAAGRETMQRHDKDVYPERRHQPKMQVMKMSVLIALKHVDTERGITFDNYRNVDACCDIGG